ncbi:MAG: sugar phosphate isomerase/epimerase [Sphaerochaetaceae bacterium]|nr:sugar phosphate isomerase/epimerase [Sphaerochaetaceae bacterium]
MLNIGFRAHDFDYSEGPEKLAQTISAIKSPCEIHFAFKKIIPDAFANRKNWNEDYIASITKDFSDLGIHFGIVGVNMNPVHPIEEERKNQVDRFIRGLELNKAFGSRVIASETGSWTLDNEGFCATTYEPRVFDIFLHEVDRMLEAAIKHDAVIAFEPVAFHHVLSTIERTCLVLERFNDSHLMLLFDPINLIPQTGLPEFDGSSRQVPSLEAQRNYYNTALDAFEGRIAAMHLKDYKLMDNGYKKGNLPALTGVFDTKGFLEEVQKRNINVPILLENLDPTTVRETLKTLESFAI